MNRPNGQLRLFAQREPWDMGSVALYLRMQSVSCAVSSTHLAKPLEFEEQPRERNQLNVAQAPTLRLWPDEAQRLMDELWQCGLRPAEGTGSAGALAATQRHLDDMRALVFKAGMPGGKAVQS